MKIINWATFTNALLSLDIIFLIKLITSIVIKHNTRIILMYDKNEDTFSKNKVKSSFVQINSIELKHTLDRSRMVK